MGCLFLKESIRPGTSASMVNHMCFTNHHHYGHLTHEATLTKYKSTVLGESIDFEKMDKLVAESRSPKMVDHSSPSVESYRTPLLTIHYFG